MHRAWNGMTQWRPFEMMFDYYGVEFRRESFGIARQRGFGNGIVRFDCGDCSTFDFRPSMSADVFFVVVV